MKKLILFIIAILLVNTAIAENKVFIVDLSYKGGEINVNEVMTKAGYHPDRKIQSETGYTLELISEDGLSLYSFKFQIPLRIYTDVINEGGEVEGGVIVLNETNFALVLPYFDDAKYIKIYDIDNKEVLSKAVVPSFGERTTLEYVFGFIIIAIVLFFFFYRRKPRKIIGVVR